MLESSQVTVTSAPSGAPVTVRVTRPPVSAAGEAVTARSGVPRLMEKARVAYAEPGPSSTARYDPTSAGASVSGTGSVESELL